MCYGFLTSDIRVMYYNNTLNEFEFLFKRQPVPVLVFVPT